MALPTGTSRGSGLSRSEAAILAWKKRKAGGGFGSGALDPKIAARVREILASKVKGKKKKGKGKAAAKPKATDAEKQAAKEQKKAEADKAKAAERGKNVTKVGEDTDLGDNLSNLDKFKGGRGLNDKDAAELEKQGLVERGKDGTVRMSGAGAAVLAAAARGDSQGAKDAASRGRDAAAGKTEQATAKQDREKTKAAKVQERAAKHKKQQQAQKEKAQARTKIAAEKAKAKAEKEGQGVSRETPAPAKQTADDKKKAAQEKADRDQGDLLASIADNPKKLGFRQSGDLERAGLIEKTSDGYQLTDKGKKKIAARQKEIDASKPKQGVSRVTPPSPKLKPQFVGMGNPKPVKAIDMDELFSLDELLAIKAGARHSKTDMQHLQGIHDSSVACGASCGPESDGSDEEDMQATEDAGKAIKGIMDDPGYYASHECGDIMQAANALSTLAMLIQSELAEDDEDPAHISMLCDASRTLVDFIGSELDELEGAAKDAAHDAGMGPMKAIRIIKAFRDAPLDDQIAVWEEIKAIGEREDVNPKAGIAEYGKVDFADAKNKKYPIDTADHVRAAWNYIAKDANAAKYAADEVAQIKAKIVGAWKKLIDKAGPPSAGKALDDAWLHIDGEAIKALDNDILRGYAVRFGDAQHPDLQKDYYTKSTDFWLNHFGWPRPITYHHGMDAETRNDPVIGHWLKAGVDDVGVWMEGQMDRAHAYYKAMKELAQRGYLRLSSDSAPQWVIREKQTNGVNEIKRWPLVTSSVTVTPMEPRMLPVEVKAYLADIGYETIDTDAEAINPDVAEADGQKATDDERARAILLELDLLALEIA